MTPDSTKGLYKDKARGAFLEDIFIMVKKKREEGDSCRVQEIKRNKMNTIEQIGRAHV